MCGVWLYVFLKRHILHQQSVWGHSLTFRLCPKVGQLGQTWRQTSQTVMSTVCTANAPWTPTIGISSTAADIWTVGVATCWEVNCRASAIIYWEYSSLWRLFCYHWAVHCRHCLLSGRLIFATGWRKAMNLGSSINMVDLGWDIYSQKW